MGSTLKASGPVARHGALASPNPLSRLVALVAVALTVLLVAAAGVAGFAVWNTFDAMGANAVDLGDGELPPAMGEIEGGVKLLLVGTDSCEGQDLALFPRCAEDDGGERNDVTMLVNISDNPRRVTVVSFPRDMLVPIPACPAEDGDEYSAMSEQPINASYTYGGLGCTVKTVEALTGEEIQFAAAIRWTGVINMSDAIGGVEVCVAGDISDGHTGLNLTAGTHTLMGAEALQFLRIRHGIGNGSDLGRISNQQQFMSSLVRTLQSGAVFSDPGKLLPFATTAMAQVTQGQLLLSTGLADPTRMVQIAMALKDVAYEDIVFVQYPTEYSEDFVNLYPVTDAADVLFEALRANRPLVLTGEASAGDGVEITGEAPPPEGDASESAAPSVAPDDVVTLPSEITGTTAAQVTCTLPEE